MGARPAKAPAPKPAATSDRNSLLVEIAELEGLYQFPHADDAPLLALDLLITRLRLMDVFAAAAHDYWSYERDNLEAIIRLADKDFPKLKLPLGNLKPRVDEARALHLFALQVKELDVD